MAIRLCSPQIPRSLKTRCGTGLRSPCNPLQLARSGPATHSSDTQPPGQHTLPSSAHALPPSDLPRGQLASVVPPACLPWASRPCLAGMLLLRWCLVDGAVCQVPPVVASPLLMLAGPPVSSLGAEFYSIHKIFNTEMIMVKIILMLQGKTALCSF